MCFHDWVIWLPNAYLGTRKKRTNKRKNIIVTLFLEDPFFTPTFFLNNNIISVLILKNIFFHFRKTLKTLHLSENRFTKIPSALKDAIVLESLNLDENPLEILDEINAFPNLPSLKRLSMCSLPYVTHIGRHVFSQLPVLEELYLCDCPRLTDIDEDSLVMHVIK